MAILDLQHKITNLEIGKQTPEEQRKLLLSLSSYSFTGQKSSHHYCPVCVLSKSILRTLRSIFICLFSRILKALISLRFYRGLKVNTFWTKTGENIGLCFSLYLIWAIEEMSSMF